MKAPTVIKRSLHTFQLQIGNRLELVSVHRLKPAFVAKGTQPAQPVSRRRPKGSPNTQPPSKSVKCTTHAPKRVHFNLRPDFFSPVPSAQSTPSRRSVRVTRPSSRLSL